MQQHSHTGYKDVLITWCWKLDCPRNRATPLPGLPGLCCSSFVLSYFFTFLIQSKICETEVRFLRVGVESGVTWTGISVESCPSMHIFHYVRSKLHLLWIVLNADFATLCGIAPFRGRWWVFSAAQICGGCCTGARFIHWEVSWQYVCHESPVASLLAIWVYM